MQRKTSTNSAIGRHVIARNDEVLIAHDVTHGMLGRITDLEHHEVEPWTRYTVQFTGGPLVAGMIAGRHIKVLSFDEAEALGQDGTLRS